MQSYNLYIKFYSPMIYYHPPTLDAIIAYCLAKEANDKRGFYQLPGKIPDDNKRLDLLHTVIEHKGGGYGVPVSSYLQVIGPIIDFMDSWKKRFESKYAKIADFGKARRRINTASGQYRSYNMPLPAKIIKMGFFSFIGDGERIMKLIDLYIIGIGKKVGEGFGWIDKMELKESQLTWQDILHMRPVPLFLAENHQITGGRKMICGWKPPYWEKRNICECIVPCEK